MLQMIFDTETTGFPRKSLPLDHESQPHLIQLGVVVDEDHKIVYQQESLISCPVPISPEATAVHGITDEMVLELGSRLELVLEVFDTLLNRVDRIVCHNLAFDSVIMKIAYARIGANAAELDAKPALCTMLIAVPVLKLEGKYPGKYKWPKLEEAYKSLVDRRGFMGAHSALPDALATRKVLLALERAGYVPMHITN